MLQSFSAFCGFMGTRIDFLKKELPLLPGCCVFSCREHELCEAALLEACRDNMPGRILPRKGNCIPPFEHEAIPLDMQGKCLFAGLASCFDVDGICPQSRKHHLCPECESDILVDKDGNYHCENCDRKGHLLILDFISDSEGCKVSSKDS